MCSGERPLGAAIGERGFCDKGYVSAPVVTVTVTGTVCGFRYFGGTTLSMLIDGFRFQKPSLVCGFRRGGMPPEHVHLQSSSINKKPRPGARAGLGF